VTSALYPVRKALIARLVGDATLVGLLGRPAIYCPVAPQGALVPLLVYDGGAESGWHSFRRPGVSVTGQLVVETTVSNYDAHEAIVSRVQDLLERTELTLDAPWDPAVVTFDPGQALTEGIENGVLICRRVLSCRVRSLTTTS
jgi:hypothetical protein